MHNPSQGATHRVVVYGTLRPGSGPTRLVPGVMYDIGAFPGVKLGGASEFVAEVIEVDDDGLRRLDSYEGYREDDPDNSLYLRVQLPDGCWIYEFNEPLYNKPVVPSGDWLEHVGSTRGRAAGLGDNGF